MIKRSMDGIQQDHPFGPLRVALVGCGRHCQHAHADPMARFARAHPDQLRLAAVCDIKLERAEAFHQRFGFERVYDSLDRLLDEEPLDACVCVMPVNCVVEVAMTVLRRRIPCVIEKPLGDSLDEAQRLAECARQTQTPHMVSMNRRFNPHLNRALGWARQQGPLRYLRATMMRSARREPEFMWATGVHLVDAMRHIGGEVESSAARAHPVNALVAWHTIDLSFVSGAIGRADVLPTAGLLEETYDMIGDEWRAVVHVMASGDEPAIQCWRNNRRVHLDAHGDSAPETEGAGRCEDAELSEFVSALRAGRMPTPSIEDVLPSLEICHAADVATSRGTERLVGN